MQLLQPPKWLTVIIPIIRGDLIERCLKTLYKYTEAGSFYVYIIDQTIKGLDATALRNKYRNLMVIRTPKSDIHYTGNLGFAQATNLGVSLVQTPYFMTLNDDVEFINSKWFQGVRDTFEQVEKATPDTPAVIVCPASIRLADWSVGRGAGDDFDILPYKKKYSEGDWDFLVNQPHYVNEHLTIEPDSVFDGVTMYATVCDTKRFLEIGMVDELFYPGGAEDYDYGCRARMHNYRSLSTTKSWVFHHWSSSFKSVRDEEEMGALVQDELRQGNLNDKWGFRKDGKTPMFDLWGVRCEKCDSILETKDNKVAVCPKHPDETYQISGTTSMPL